MIQITISLTCVPVVIGAEISHKTVTL